MKMLLTTCTLACAFAQPPDVTTIMARVAANQSRAQELRKSYIYNQKQLLRLVRGNGRIAREERREYAITPEDRGFHKDLTRFEGKYDRHGQFVAYDRPGYEYKGMDIDGELIDDLSRDLTSDRKSRDGISYELFPFTRSEQAKYDFKLKGIENWKGRAVYRVAFQPKPHLEDMGAWKGEALIDTEECQPVSISTNLASKIPLAVKTLLGTNIRGLGFSVTYAKFDGDVWFPVSYGGEFELRAAFFYKRTISISLANSDFRRTDVTSRVAYATNDQ